MVRTQALAQNIPPELADAVARVESGYRPQATGEVGEIGLMQVLPSTARMLGFTGSDQKLADPATNIRYGVGYLAGAWRLSGEDICTATMKYRAGHGETRFSHKSVAYCLRVRAELAAQGYPVRGTVPRATFGEPASMTAVGGMPVRTTRKSRVNWSAYDNRIKAIESRVTRDTLTIMR